MDDCIIDGGYKLTDMVGGIGVIPKEKKPKIKATSLAEMFKLKPSDSSNDNEPQRG